MNSLLALAALIVATIAALKADGGSAPSQVQAILTEFAVTLEPMAVAPGAVEVNVANEGAVSHTLALEGSHKVTDLLGAGEEAVLALGDLKAGRYTLYCDVPGHREAGMEAALTVTEEASPAAAGGHTDGPDYAALDRAMQESIRAFPASTEGTGAQILEPIVLPDGTKQFELVARVVDWEVEPGKRVEAWTYNGQVPGPTIKVGIGERFRVLVRNELPMGTDVHWHGLRTPNSMDGVAPITQPLIEPGQTFTYELSVDRPAVAMYHPHHHAQIQVPNGMLGTVIVGRLPLPEGRTFGGRTLPASIPVAQELPLVLNDAGTIGYSLNGKSFPATAPVAARTGEWLLVHYLNEGLQIHPMHLHGTEVLVVARDGAPLDEPFWVDTLSVAPGERYSILVPADNPGTWAWHCHILNHVEREEGMFGMVTALVVG